MVTQLGETCGNLSLGSSNGSGTVQVAGGSLFTVNNQYVGNSGMGAVTQSSGTNSIGYLLYLGYDPGSSGMYSLSGSGQLSASVELIGSSGTGTFTQSGGTNGIGDPARSRLQRRQHGTYNLSGSGQVSPRLRGSWAAPARGPSRSPAGPTVSGTISVLGSGTGSSGTYNLSGSGQVSAAYEYVGGLRHGDLHAVRRDQQHRQLSLSRLPSPAAAARTASAAAASCRRLRRVSWAIPARGPSRSPAGPTAYGGTLFISATLLAAAARTTSTAACSSSPR